MKPLLWTKLIVRRFVPLMEFCKRCGRSNGGRSFHVGDATWQQVYSGYNTLCVLCFVTLARRHGHYHWSLRSMP